MFCVAIIFALITSACGSIRPLIYTALITNGHWPFGVEFISGLPLNEVPSVLLLVIVEVTDATVQIGLGVLLSYLSADIGKQLRLQLTSAIQSTLAGHANETLNRYLSFTKNYIDIIEQYYRQYLVQTISSLLQIIITLSIAYNISVYMGGLLVLEILFLLVLTSIYSKIYPFFFHKKMIAEENLLLGAALTPRRAFAIWFGGVGDFWYSSRVKEIKEIADTRFLINSADTTFLITTTIFTNVYVVIGYLMLASNDTGNVSNFLTFFVYSGFILGPAIRLSSFLPEYKEYGLSIKSLMDISSFHSTESDKNRQINELSFKAIKEDSDKQLGFTVNQGDRVALIGPSGVGKSTTLLDLMGASNLNFSQATISGKSAKDVRFELPKLGVRYLVDTPVFEAGTIELNCLCDFNEALKINKEYCLFKLTDHDFKIFLKTIILSSGEPLSLGERQRIQLLRALASCPKALFLDEALSGIEESLESKIITKLIVNKSILTIVYVGHRQSIQDLFQKKIYLV